MKILYIFQLFFFIIRRSSNSFDIPCYNHHQYFIAILKLSKNFKFQFPHPNDSIEIESPIYYYWNHRFIFIYLLVCFASFTTSVQLNTSTFFLLPQMVSALDFHWIQFQNFDSIRLDSPNHSFLMNETKKKEIVFFCP